MLSLSVFVKKASVGFTIYKLLNCTGFTIYKLLNILNYKN